ncbi:hypothetical protein VTK56DRAFT_6757 [Thermocarpiscus australiensis]
MLEPPSMTSPGVKMLAIRALTKFEPAANPPDHHIVSIGTSTANLSWNSYLPPWAPSPKRIRSSLGAGEIVGFRNPWSSSHKATLSEIWNSLQWGEGNDPCVQLAASHLVDATPSDKPDPNRLPRFSDINDWPDSPGAKAARLLRIEEPGFSFHPEPDSCSTSDIRAKVTWLGHASVLVQLPPIAEKEGRPVRCLFDPIFSMRCSGSQSAGPIRSYPPPCNVQDLPLIDAVFISHNHYDHMDYDTIMAVWRQSREFVRFFVPLGNKKWLLDWGIAEHRVVEMDWWDSVQLNHPASSSGKAIKLWCTPAQHNSWRAGVDANSALWSSWCVEYLAPNNPPYRVFFAGDTGYQFHDSPSWPPSPGQRDDDVPAEDEKFPACPAFAEIRDRIGPPHLLLLPVSVGATFAYLRSFVPLPNAINPFPRHSAGVSAAKHMPPWDAVRVLKVMTETGSGEGGNGTEDAVPVVAVAMHWGTFVTDPVEVLRTLGQLEWACRRHDVRFARSWPGSGCVGKGDSDAADGSSETGESIRASKPWFLALNHGQSVCI